MELPRTPGSIVDVRDRLLLWACRSQQSLARGEFATEFSRLRLTEYQPVGERAGAAIEINSTGSTYANIDDAHHRSYNLLQRLQAAQEAGAEDGELLETYLLPTLEALAAVGAQQSLQDLSLQFEGMLGQLKMTDSPQLANALDRIANLYAD